MTNLTTNTKCRILNSSNKYSNIEFIFGDIFNNLELQSTEYYNLIVNNADWSSEIRKDIFDGDILTILNIAHIDGISKMLKVLSSNHLTIEVDLRKEFNYLKDFILRHTEDAYEVDDINELILFLTNNQTFLNGQKITIVKNNNKFIGSLYHSHLDFVVNNFDEILKSQKGLDKRRELIPNPATFDCKIYGKNEGGFFVNIEGITAFLPGSLAGANKIIDFNSMIGKTVPVMLDDYLNNSNTYVVSHKKYIENILPSKLDDLRLNILKTQYSGVITGVMKFGLFIEFESIFTGLLHFSAMDSNFYQQFKNGEFAVGDSIQFFIKEIGKDNRIILCSNNEELDIWTLFNQEYEEKYLEGQIFNITNFGIFVNFKFKNQTLRGLLLFKNLTKEQKLINFKLYDNINCYISKVDVEQKKIFLSL